MKDEEFNIIAARKKELNSKKGNVQKSKFNTQNISQKQDSSVSVGSSSPSKNSDSEERMPYKVPKFKNEKSLKE